MADVVLRNLKRVYSGVTAVDDVSLTVADGEFLTLLGPSGCGKSTTLGMLAGLDRPDAGSISVGGQVFFDAADGRYVEAERRNIGLVFQSYALWPHMTVEDNVAFALRLRRVSRAERTRRVRDALALVEMDHLAGRYPSQLSGGQQQRVALARTLAYSPAILLLDEPLSNLDAKLRDKARSWLRKLQSEVGITTIFVTHDQSEALALSDRIAVMDRGRIVQIGTPAEIYERPATPFVADFIGASNFVQGTVVGMREGTASIRLKGGGVIEASCSQPLAAGAGAHVTFRPERMQRREDGRAEGNVMHGKIVEETYLGSRIQYAVDIGGEIIRWETLDPVDAKTVDLCISPRHCSTFPGVGTAGEPASRAHPGL